MRAHSSSVSAVASGLYCSYHQTRGQYSYSATSLAVKMRCDWSSFWCCRDCRCCCMIWPGCCYYCFGDKGMLLRQEILLSMHTKSFARIYATQLLASLKMLFLIFVQGY